MMKSNALGLPALRRAVSLHLKACVVSFLAVVALVVLATIFWPGGAPLVVLLVGSVAAVAVGVLVPLILHRRKTYLRTAEDVEGALQLRVLATYSSSPLGHW
jgi:hypothetical protein